MKPHATDILFALAAAGSLIAATPRVQAAPAVDITITIAGIKSPQGFMMIALHDEKGWSGAPVARLRVAVAGTTVRVTLPAPAPGRYGIKMFQDVDGDGQMATNIVGFPTEPVGFSNDAPIRLGPPSFADAGFAVGPAGASQTITLR